MRHPSSSDSSRRHDRILAASLLVATGAAALGHQVLWSRRILDLLGSGAESSVRVFLCFFVGLSLGAAIVSLRLGRILNPWQTWAIAEVGIVFTSIPLLTLPLWSSHLWRSLGLELLISTTGSAVKTMLSIILLVPPAILMGMTLPLAVAASLNSGRSSRDTPIFLYTANTFGGVLGIAITTAFAIPVVGVTGGMSLFLVINVAAALLCFWRSRGAPQSSPSEPVITSKPMVAATSLTPRQCLSLAFFSGAGVMGIEVLALQLFDLAVPLSFYPPAAILFAIITLLALASALTSRLVQKFCHPSQLLVPAVSLASLGTCLMPILFFAFPGTRTADIVVSTTVGEFLTRLGLIGFSTLGLAMLASGVIFPLTLMHFYQAPSSSYGGGGVGTLLALNGLGGVIGSEIVRAVLVPTFGVHVSLGVLAIAYAIAAVVCLSLGRPMGAITRALPLLAVLVTACVTLGVLARLPLFLWSRSYTVVETRSTRDGVLTVFEREGFGRGLSLNNQYLLGGSGSASDAQRQAHIPMLLHTNPVRVAFAGLGTGITASGALKYPSVAAITIAELSLPVVAAARKHFAPYNDSLLEREKVSILVQDARTLLSACDSAFDVIVGELFTPWRPGEAGLCSAEYFRDAHRSLRPGGVFCQWIAGHQLTEEQLKCILATFRTVFPEAHLFRNHLKSSNTSLGLVGLRSGTMDWQVAQMRCSSERQAGLLLDPLVRHVEGLAMLYLGPVEDTPSALGQNTLANMVVEISAGKSLILAKPGQYLTYAADGNPWPRLVRDRVFQLRDASEWPVPLRSLPMVGLLVTNLELAGQHDPRAAGEIANRLDAAFPQSILADNQSDWSLWAGHPSTAPGGAQAQPAP